LFRSLCAETITLSFTPTERNTPLQEFVAALHVPAGSNTLSRETFLQAAYDLPHEIVGGDVRLAESGSR
jgi:hypothetical protein